MLLKLQHIKNKNKLKISDILFISNQTKFKKINNF
jgi:hypothetical protein